MDSASLSDNEDLHPNMWSTEPGTECDCHGPPPKFLIPPPPRPPFTQPADSVYGTEDFLPIETCDAYSGGWGSTATCIKTTRGLSGETVPLQPFVMHSSSQNNSNNNNNGEDVEGQKENHERASRGSHPQELAAQWEPDPPRSQSTGHSGIPEFSPPERSIPIGSQFRDSSGKKRKPVYDGRDIFGKSSKVTRTPSKTNNENEDKLDLLIRMMRELKSESKQIKTEQEECREEIKKIREENQTLWKENQELKRENEEMKIKIEEISDKVEWLEKQRKKNNVVIQGIKMDTNDAETIKKTIKIMMEKELAIDVQVKASHKLGEKTCLIELEKEEDKEKIMKNKHKHKHNKN
ncbi:unnamed protein product [Phaedon cochleariae]|uniref:Uncharacterized protein n=1 Tax=Phaedon cochleariae TaxID=80249 RepID=A0A9P0DQK3_PHACE|nr:unnamed protein product [Phaedon cochleariae]